MPRAARRPGTPPPMRRRAERLRLAPPQGGPPVREARGAIRGAPAPRPDARPWRGPWPQGRARVPGPRPGACRRATPALRGGDASPGTWSGPTLRRLPQPTLPPARRPSRHPTQDRATTDRRARGTPRTLLRRQAARAAPPPGRWSGPRRGLAHPTKALPRARRRSRPPSLLPPIPRPRRATRTVPLRHRNARPPGMRPQRRGRGRPWPIRGPDRSRAPRLRAGSPRPERSARQTRDPALWCRCGGQGRTDRGPLRTRSPQQSPRPRGRGAGPRDGLAEPPSGPMRPPPRSPATGLRPGPRPGLHPGPRSGPSPARRPGTAARPRACPAARQRAQDRRLFPAQDPCPPAARPIRRGRTPGRARPWLFPRTSPARARPGQRAKPIPQPPGPERPPGDSPQPPAPRRPPPHGPALRRSRGQPEPRRGCPKAQAARQAPVPLRRTNSLRTPSRGSADPQPRASRSRQPQPHRGRSPRAYRRSPPGPQSPGQRGRRPVPARIDPAPAP